MAKKFLTPINVGQINISPTGQSSPAQGSISWNSVEGTIDFGLEGGIVLKNGQELHARVKNETGSQINNGELVYIAGEGESTPGHPAHPLINKFIADGSVNAAQIVGICTENILDDEHGYVTAFGMVRGIDTSSYSAGTELYASAATPGSLTEIQPVSPNQTIVVGVVVESSALTGSIFVNPKISPTADLVTYSNEDAALSASNVKGALDELSMGKADINSLSSNINLYATTADSDVSGYYVLVDNISDEDYDTTAVNIGTGGINSSNQLIASLSSKAGLVVGNPGVIGITTIGNIRKTSGNKNNYGEFFFRVYKRNSSGTETLLSTSDTTGAINPEDLNEYLEFSATALTSFTELIATDRIVIKYYANNLSGSGSEYDFLFGGDNPVRTLVPVPVSVIPIANASGIIVDTSSFNNNLSSLNTNVQSALNTLDDIITLPNQSGNADKFLQTDGTNPSWSTLKNVSYSPEAPTSPSVGDLWIESDVEVPTFDPQVFTRWTLTVSADQSIFSGTSSGVLLKYTQGLEQVFLNGILLVRGVDYTATNGTSVTLTSDALDGDVVEVVSPNSFQLDNSSATPDQAGNSGKFLSTNGTNTIWSDVDQSSATDLTDHESDTTNVHGISDTSILATKEYADNAASSASAAIVDSSPETLNTLNELAAALGDDANFATTVTNSIASKQKTIPLQNTQPNSPSTGDLWVDNAETTKPKLKSYDGSAWVEVGSTVEADSDQIIISTRMFT